MSDDNDTSAEDKTEEPSQRRLDEARKDGKVALSRDLAAGVGGLVGAVVIDNVAVDVVDGGVESYASVISKIDRIDQAPPLGELLLTSCQPLWAPLGAVLAAVAAVSLVTTLAQTRGGVWSDQAAPDIAKAFSPTRVLHAFTREGLADTGLALVKALAITLVCVDVAADKLWGLGNALLASPASCVAVLGATTASMATRSSVVLALAGVLDFVLRYRRTMAELRMTKDELKREAKEDEGDPHIRAARRRRHRDLKRGSIHKEVPRADAVVVNPTHIAVALRYRRKSDKAPRVVAKGSGAKAQAMRAIAVEHGVPIVKDVPLARLLHKRVRVGRQVPQETYRAVAAVLAFVTKVTGRPPGADRPGDDDDDT